MVKLLYKGNIKRIKAASEIANKILSSSEFYSRIRDIDKFDQTSLSGSDIAGLMENAGHTVTVTGALKPIANASTETSDEIKVSVFRFGWRLKTGVNTLVHETVHAIDLLNSKTDFTHSTNDNSDGRHNNTAPWVIGKIAEDMCSTL